jgi:hypothetical protein
VADDAHARYARVNLPHARTIAARIGRSLDALGAFAEQGNGGAAGLNAAYDALEAACRAYDEDPPFERALAAADDVAAVARPLVEAILRAGARSDRLGQHVRNLFECLGLPEEGAELSLKCGERPDSPLR